MLRTDRLERKMYNPFDPVAEDEVEEMADDLSAFDVPAVPPSPTTAANTISTAELDKILRLVESSPDIISTFPPQIRNAIQNQLAKRETFVLLFFPSSTFSFIHLFFVVFRNRSLSSSSATSLTLRGQTGSPPVALGESSLVDLRKFFAAAKAGRISEIRSILSSGRINVNDRDDEGNTVLHYAAYRDELEVVRVLVEEGRAHLDLANHGESNTPLHWYEYSHSFSSKHQKQLTQFLFLIGLSWDHQQEQQRICYKEGPISLLPTSMVTMRSITQHSMTSPCWRAT